MSLSEALATGGVVTVTGLSIVFLVLIVLMLVMLVMKAIFYKETPKQSEAQPVQEVKPEPKAAPAEASPAEDPNLIIAVLTAAVAASLNTSTNKLNIKSYRRIGSSAPAWNRAGLNDVINSRF